MATEEEIVKLAFNAGYVMAEHEPKLLDSILKSNNTDNEYIQAMAAGKKQRRKELLIIEQRKITPTSPIKPKHQCGLMH